MALVVPRLPRGAPFIPFGRNVGEAPAFACGSATQPMARHHFRTSSRTLLLSQGDGDESSVEAAGDVAFEGAHGFAGGLAFADAAVEVGAGLLVVAAADAGDGV